MEKRPEEYRAGDKFDPTDPELYAYGVELCRAQAPDSPYICTRPKGHEGAHIAAWGTRIVCCDAWTDKKVEAEKVKEEFGEVDVRSLLSE